MICFESKLLFSCVLAGALLSCAPAFAADAAAEEDNTRAVKILQAPDPPPAAVPAAPTPPAPPAPSSAPIVMPAAPPASSAPATPLAAPAASPSPGATPSPPSVSVATPSLSVPATAPAESPAALPPLPSLPIAPPTAVATPAPQVPPPSELSPFAPPTLAPAGPSPIQAPEQAAAPAVITPAPTPVTTPSAQPLDYPAARKQAALGTIPLDPKTFNSAEVSLELLPGLDIAVGTTVKFRVTSKRPGYLILVDVDATGKLTQLYPAPRALTEGRVPPVHANYLKPGKPLLIPSPGDNFAGVEYVAAPPSGVAMIVAILSDKPVQLIDLPDVPTTLMGQTEALAFLTQLTKELRIPRGESGAMQEARWSFDAKFYAIR